MDIIYCIMKEENNLLLLNNDEANDSNSKIIQDQKNIAKFLYQKDIFIKKSNKYLTISINPTLIKSQSFGIKKMWIFFVIITNKSNLRFQITGKKWIVKEDNKQDKEILSTNSMNNDVIIDPNSSFEYFNHIIIEGNISLLSAEFTFLNVSNNSTMTLKSDDITLLATDDIVLN